MLARATKKQGVCNENRVFVEIVKLFLLTFMGASVYAYAPAALISPACDSAVYPFWCHRNAPRPPFGTGGAGGGAINDTQKRFSTDQKIYVCCPAVEADYE